MVTGTAMETSPSRLTSVRFQSEPSPLAKEILSGHRSKIRALEAITQEGSRLYTSDSDGMQVVGSTDHRLLRDDDGVPGCTIGFRIAGFHLAFLVLRSSIAQTRTPFDFVQAPD